VFIHGLYCVDDGVVLYGDDVSGVVLYCEGEGPSVSKSIKLSSAF
jgi:hypothetical protein